jgi:hypothetical protein
VTGEQNAAGLFGRHAGGEIGGRFMVPFALVAAPFHEKPIGESGKEPADRDGAGRAQPALFVAAPGIEPGVKSALNALG